MLERTINLPVWPSWLMAICTLYGAFWLGADIGQLLTRVFMK